MYKEQYDELDAVLKDRAKDNAPTDRQAAGFVSYPELQRVKKNLTIGSKERLLLSFYGGLIPPLRNDLHACAIRMLKCDDDATRQVLLQQLTPNEILIPYDRSTLGILILREWKTQDRMNPKLYTRSLGKPLTNEIIASLLDHPRDYLFVESSSGRPYRPYGFGMYARRTLQKLFGRPCSLTLLRY